MQNKMLFSKQVDKSLLNAGLTLPVGAAKEINSILGLHLGRGEKRTISIDFEGSKFSAILTHVNMSSGRDVFQIRYGSNSSIGQALKRVYKSPEQAKKNGDKIEIWLMEKGIAFVSTSDPVKKSFFDYLGPEDSLYGYQKSYKLVFYYCYFSESLYADTISTERLTKQFRQFYIDRKRFALLPELNGASEIVLNPEKSTDRDFYKLIMQNPFNAIEKKGFFQIKKNRREEFFCLQEKLYNSLSEEDLNQIRNIVAHKLLFYYQAGNLHSDTNKGRKEKIDTPNKPATLREAFVKFSNEYLTAKSQPIGGNPLAKFIVTDLPQAVLNTNNISSSTHKVIASAGKGNWASIPWLCILDKQITDTPQEGVYIVYLLSKDARTLYITLNQGCTMLRKKNSKEKVIKSLHKNAKEITAKIDSKGYKAGNGIKLGEQITELGELYQEGCIFYKAYKTDSLPSEDELITDLKNMISIYADYVKQKNVPTLPSKPLEPAWLLTWNPEHWVWNDYAANIEACKFGKKCEAVWSCANSHIKSGEKVYLVKLGNPGERGIIASGVTISGIFQTPHWDRKRAVKGETVNSVRVVFDKILDYRSDPILSIKRLQEQYPDQAWSPQCSGIEIKEQYVEQLAEQWSRIKA